jgi:hypothetical protein
VTRCGVRAGCKQRASAREEFGDLGDVGDLGDLGDLGEEKF